MEQQNEASGQGTVNEFSFSGSGAEYFGIWIVNLLLSILTLGIYTAWAKVRRLRYFYGNTWLDGHNFEYHAKPLQILIGRVVVVGYLVFANILSEVNPFLGAILFVPYLIALPWIFNKAISFNAKMTSYRNVHFSFEGSYWRAFGIFVILPIIAFAPIVIVGGGIGWIYSDGTEAANPVFGVLILAAFIAAIAFIPFITRASSNYIGNNTKLGSAAFETNMPLGAIYANLGTSFLFTLLACAALLGIIFAGAAGMAPTGSDFDDIATNPMANVGGLALVVLFGLLVYTPFILGYLFYRAGNRNIAFRSTVLGGEHQLSSTLSRFKYIWIIVSNAILTICSFALLRPWAAVRTWRYLAVNTAVISTSGLDQLIAGQDRDGNVIAAEYLDLDGIDFGL